VETDLGEYILQVNNNEPPSHIIAPAVHKSLDDVADLFHKVHGTPRKTDPGADARGARVLRGHFLSPTWASRAATSWSPRPARWRWSPTRATAAW
jgi:L-lactate utilization protein LutB